MKTSNRYKTQASNTARKQRKIQDEIEAIDRRSRHKESQRAMQAGARRYPAPPFLSSHLSKPAKESSLEEMPMCDAPYYKGSEKLKNKVAVITGGDSGIGRSVGILFAREGADVAIIYLNEHSDARTTKQLIEKEGQKCLLVSGDVSDQKFCQHAINSIIKDFGKIDILVNNAAFQLHAELDDLSEEHFDMTLKTNLYGYFHMVRASIEFMKPGSSIINTGSVTGLLGNKNLLDYSLTKGGIHALTRSLGAQLIEKGIRVNAVAPGPVWTPLNPADKKKKDIRTFGKHTPMRRPAQPEEIAPAYVFLASPQCSSYITGEIIPIIGGYNGG